MPKTESPHLFHLIKSLSKAEKRYFKLFSRLNALGKGSKYVKLFDAIDNQKQYDEKKIIAEFKNNGYESQFPVLKNYLYAQTLKSMEIFHINTNTEVRSLITSAEFLHERGLYQESKRFLIKAKQQAYKHEMFPDILRIISCERDIASSKQDLQTLQSIQAETKKILVLIQNTTAYRAILDEMQYLYLSSGKIKERARRIRLNKLIKASLQKNISRALTFGSKINYYWNHTYYCQITGDLKGCYLYTKNIIDLFQAYPEKQKSGSGFVMILSNMVHLCLQLKKHNEAFNHLSQLGQAKNLLSPNTENAKIHFYRYTILSLDYFAERGLFNEAILFINESLDEIKKYENKISELERVILWTSISICFFAIGNFHRSIFWINKALNENSGSIRKDIEIFINLFNLMSHFEAENLDIIPSIVKRNYRLISGDANYSFKTHRLLLDFFDSKVVEKNTKQEKRQAYIELKTQIVPLANDSHEKQLFQYFDFISWVESKIEKRPFAEVMRERANMK